MFKSIYEVEWNYINLKYRKTNENWNKVFGDVPMAMAMQCEKLIVW